MKLKKVELLAVYVLSFIMMFWTFLPIYNMIVTSFKTFGDV
jgi:ABC-type glycerol-3-phosphate transport system permease component